MIIHGDTLISEDIFEQNFICHIDKCKGICCVEGDYGAPLEEEEIPIIQSHLEAIKPYMSVKGLEVLAKDGFYEKDKDGDLVTTCVKKRDCVFAISENGIYKCAIEKAYLDNKIDFHKPISCHLYPIRLSKVSEFTAINYSRWYICSAACKLGDKEKVPMYAFLKQPLIRRFGEEWYKDLEDIAEIYKVK